MLSVFSAPVAGAWVNDLLVEKAVGFVKSLPIRFINNLAAQPQRRDRRREGGGSFSLRPSCLCGFGSQPDKHD
jgi:hypothetical protein